MSDFLDDFAEDFQDTLTVKGFTPGPEDGAGVPTGPGVTRVLLPPQPCSDQDASPSRRFRGEINSGVQGSLPVSICYTAYFKLPDLNPGETLSYEVNGRRRPLMRQGPPQDIGGQHVLAELELGAPL